jgi:hypothetical protein
VERKNVVSRLARKARNRVYAWRKIRDGGCQMRSTSNEKNASGTVPEAFVVSGDRTRYFPADSFSRSAAAPSRSRRSTAAVTEGGGSREGRRSPSNS